MELYKVWKNILVGFILKNRLLIKVLLSFIVVGVLEVLFLYKNFCVLGIKLFFVFFCRKFIFS